METACKPSPCRCCILLALCLSLSPTDTPRTLLQLVRVSIRQSLFSMGVELSSLNLPPHLEEYVLSILDICSGEEIRNLSLQSSTLDT